MSQNFENVTDEINAIIDGQKPIDKPLGKADALSISLSFWANQGADAQELEQACETSIAFIREDKTSAAARSIKSIAQLFPEKQDQAVDVLSDILADPSLAQDVKSTATVELGALAQKASEGLTTYDVHLDKSPNVHTIKKMFSALENGESPQVARSIGPIVMETKSPTVTYEGLKLILNSKDSESAKILDEILDHKKDYDTQKITALADAISFVDDMSPEMRNSIQDYFVAALPNEIEKFEKSIKKIKGLGQLSSAFSEANAFSDGKAQDLKEAEKAVQRALQELGNKLEVLREHTENKHTID